MTDVVHVIVVNVRLHHKDITFVMLRYLKH